MKNLIKKVIISALSIISIATFAVGCDNTETNEVSGENFAPSGYIQNVTSSEGATATFSEELLVGSKKLVKGAVLYGEQGAEFNLGDINIKKSNWNGAYNTIDGEYSSFIDLYYAPTTNTVELPSVLITLTDTDNKDNYLEIYVNSVKQAGNFTNDNLILTRACTQDRFGAYLDVANKLNSSDPFNLTTTGIYKSAYLGSAAEYAGVDDGATVSLNGNQTAPVSIVYDSEDNALYSPITYDSQTSKASLKTSYCIRNFTNIYNGSLDSTDKKWGGFKSSVVNVKIKFINATTKTKLIVSGIGGYNLTGREVFVADTDYVTHVPSQPEGAEYNADTVLYAPLNYTVINAKLHQGSKVEIKKDNTVLDTITFTDKTATYKFTKLGNHTLNFLNSNNESIGVKTIYVANVAITNESIGVKTSKGASVEYGTYKQAGGDYVYSGVKLTGGDNATFDLGTISLSETFWNYKDVTYDVDNDGDYEKMLDKSVYSSFLDVVFHPNKDQTAAKNGRYIGEIDNVYVTLTDPNDPTQFVSIRLSDSRSDASFAMSIWAMSTNNEYWAAQRYFGQDSEIALHMTVSKKYDIRGNQATPIELIYDNGAVYNTSTFSAAGLKGAYAIRNFTLPDESFAEYKYDISGSKLDTKADNREKHNYWGGFTCDKVNVTVSFGDIREQYAGKDTSSIIITKLGRHNLGLNVVDIDETEYVTDIGIYGDATVGEEISIRPASKWHALHQTVYVGCYAEIYKQGETNKLDTIIFNGKAYNYTFNSQGTYLIKYYDSSGGSLGTATILVSLPTT